MKHKVTMFADGVVELETEVERAGGTRQYICIEIRKRGDGRVGINTSSAPALSVSGVQSLIEALHVAQELARKMEKQ